MKRACDEAGIVSFHKEMPEDSSEEDVLQVVRDFNADPDCHGILVQLPLPKHMNEEKVLAEISLEKDVDGFHPLNIGKLSMKGHEPLFMPCTPRVASCCWSDPVWISRERTRWWLVVQHRRMPPR